VPAQNHKPGRDRAGQHRDPNINRYEYPLVPQDLARQPERRAGGAERAVDSLDPISSERRDEDLTSPGKR
jgi:hypothetical protein